MSSAGATLQGSYSGETGTISEVGFYYGTTSGSLGSKAVATGTSSPFSKAITGLSAGTTYYYKAYVLEYSEAAGDYVYRYGDESSFTTLSSYVPTGWLELPSYTTSGMSGTTTSSLSDLYKLSHSATMGGSTQRNYTCLYDPEMYASYWVAYPLCSSHMGSGRDESWAYDPDVTSSKQTNVIAGAYGVYLDTENYTNNYYARGHQIPNADRNGVDAMMAQTYYMTNLTPQLQNGFNGGVWNNLEAAVRSEASSDTLYVVTGAAFRKKGGSESITTIVNTRDSKTLPVPNYYWKALLKVTWSGDTVTAASAVGFWLPHQDLKGADYADYAVSVDQIETWTGFDLFANLPSSLQTTAEANTSLDSFSDF